MIKQIVYFVPLLLLTSCPFIATNEPVILLENYADFAYVLDGKIICIDAGHQQYQNDEPEPVAPNSHETKPKVAKGAAGIVSGTPEYEINLSIAKKLQGVLQEHSAQVVMTRTENDVNISNVERAQIGNAANADIVVRIHCDGSDNPDAHGISVLVPAGMYISDMHMLENSTAAGRYIGAALAQSTGAKHNGIVSRSDLSGFNWSTVPVVLAECGFLSNPTEDRLLNTDSYQEKIAEGIYAGLINYFAAIVNVLS